MKEGGGARISSSWSSHLGNAAGPLCKESFTKRGSLNLLRFKRLYIKGGGDDGTLALGKPATFDRKKFLTVL